MEIISKNFHFGTMQTVFKDIAACLKCYISKSFEIITNLFKQYIYLPRYNNIFGYFAANSSAKIGGQMMSFAQSLYTF